MASSVRTQAAHAATSAGHLVRAPRGQIPTPILHSALASGISRGFVVAAAIMLAAVLITLVMIRVRRADLAARKTLLLHCSAAVTPAPEDGSPPWVAGHHPRG